MLGLALGIILGQTVEAKEMLYMELQYGVVEIELLDKVAPKHIARIKELVKKGFYDGLAFHRVIEGFMAQGGDPQGDGRGGSGETISAEFNKTPFLEGTLGMARTQDPNSGDSQFFICLAPARFLDEKYTAWGKVIKGMEYVHKLQKGEPPQNPDKITKMYIK